MVLSHKNIDDLFSCLVGKGAQALAVSGGGDSLALLHLFAEWRERFPLEDMRDVVFSVDHGLRKESGDEVKLVIEIAEKLGFTAIPLRLEGVQKGGSSLQQKAREARYTAIAHEMKQLGITNLLTAHTLDDQAETFLMRLRRGSGIDGLSSMFAERELFGISVVRPLLTVRGSDLRQWLQEHGVSWIDDPSNENEDFERVAVRQILNDLDRDGQLVEMIGQSVVRLQRGRQALEEDAITFIEAFVKVYPIGLLHVKVDELFALPLDVQIRVLRRLLIAFGAEGRSLSSLEGGIAHIASMGREKFVLAGVMCERRMDGILQFSREVGREPFEIIHRKFGDTRAKGQTEEPVREIVWDKRVVIKVPENYTGELEIRAFTNTELADLKEKYKGLGQAYPRFAAAKFILPSVAGCWSNGQLVAVPQIESYDESLFVELLGDLDDFLDGVPFERASFPTNAWLRAL